MKRPAVFFDRDNTLIANDGYLGDPAGVTLLRGAADAIAAVRSLGYAVVVVSNQSGVARGLFTEEAVQAVNRRMEELLLADNRGAIIDRHEYCPYHPAGSVAEFAHESERRKPKPGMILEAARSLALDLSRSWLVGDAARDIEAGKAAGVRTILFHDPSLAASPAAASNASAAPEFTVTSLPDAAATIAAHQPPPDVQPAESPLGRLTIPLQPMDDPIVAPLKPILHVAEQILRELRHQHEHRHSDFSVPKLFGGIVQVLALAALFFAYLFRDSPSVNSILLTAIDLQALVIALLLMGRR